MKKILTNTILLLFISLSFSQLGLSQDSNSTFEFTYGVHRVLPFISISKDRLEQAKTLIDIDPKYKSSWVREYLSVEISAQHKGIAKTAVSKNDTLSLAQKELINMADLGTDISVHVRYIPENNLVHNDIQINDFSFSIDPKFEATYTEGEAALKQYIKEKVIDKIPDGTINKYQLAAVKFTVTEEGNVVAPQIAWTSEDDKVDELLLQTVRNMSCWKAAEYANGKPVKQELVLTIGDMKSCVVNTLNIGLVNFQE